ncbi:MAG: Na(+)/H(+) antiporter subunit B [Gammaproteobacteria bacterium]|nr:Na(+)/H(+) antiporter subunit B [Gammaproteobacteria bacterium]
MIKRIFIFMMLGLMAIIFFNLAANYTENTSLSKLAHYYVEKGPQEIGAANIVTAVVVTYRGLDTLGEVTVLFISAAGVGLLLRRKKAEQNNNHKKINSVKETANTHKSSSEIVETATELLLPMIILFGVYVFLNGHLSPGGGFQGGAIIASGTMFLLLALPKSHISRLLIAITESLSGFSYVVVGVLGVVMAGGFLDNRFISSGTYGNLFSAGAIPLIYSFIGLKVGFELSAVLDRFRKETSNEEDDPV